MPEIFGSSNITASAQVVATGTRTIFRGGFLRSGSGGAGEIFILDGGTGGVEKFHITGAAANANTTVDGGDSMFTNGLYVSFGANVSYATLVFKVATA